MSILTIQSHVSYGHVGNSAAVFPLQRLGYEVWPVQTVLFSNHAGYPTVKGPVLDAQIVADVISGIEDRQVFSQCEAVLSGYLGSKELGQVVLDSVDHVKAANPHALYCCDPVMGDRGKDIYVHKDIPDFMREVVVSKADILIPNHFEMETLIGQNLSTMEEMIAASRHIIDQGPKMVVVTSVELAGTDHERISMLAISQDKVLEISTPKLPFTTPPSGAGDLSAALFLANYLKTQDMGQALSQMASSVYGILKQTFESKSGEIALIDAQALLLSPIEKFSASPVS